MTPAALSATLQRLGLSQAECARLLGVTPGAVTRWVQGGRPMPETAGIMLRAYDDNPRDFREWLKKNCATPPNNR